MASDAVISECGRYRYWLEREISSPSRIGLIVFVMLNPSTADAEKDDPTIRRCMAYAAREGAAVMEVVNLYAYRTKSPEVLKKAGYPPGPDNVVWVMDAVLDADVVVCAWGTKAEPKAAAGFLAAAKLCESEWKLHALHVNGDGSPGHPLFLKADAPLVRWPSE